MSKRKIDENDAPKVRRTEWEASNAKLAILTKAMQGVIDRYPCSAMPIDENVIKPLKQALQDADNVKE